ncbi:hypothetical protein SAMN05216262_11446 [Colwellia chukchiensis]|uniref:Uncharacterized protein n=1 Tax=Colwellia chukchiensis TaxID=641665 RepID=A0A1H7RC04_9GAMM|nr:hypothetical protein [Colwellia chukchiensis]SEL57816.1 hypothetical protein SAMN05216262_11446 [Colwellia chukchiensis]
MKLLLNKTRLGAVVLSLAMLSALPAKAQQNSLEQHLAASMHKQGQIVAQNLAATLSNSINDELQRFSMRYSTVKTQALVALTTTPQSITTKPQSAKKL